MKTIGKIASIIIFNIIGFLFLFACRSHEHRLGDYLWDDHLHWQECLECHEKINYVYHTYGSWQIVEESTEEKEGVRKQTCSACGYFKEESIPPLSHIHQFGLWYFVDIPSKDKEGKIKRICTLNDSHTQEMSLPRLNPTFYRYKIITDASCSQVGVASYSFIKDDQTLEIKVDIPMVDHTYAIDWSYDDKGHWHQATCEHSSLQKDYEEHTYKNGYCTTCNQKEDKDEHIHTFGKWELIDSPTFEQVGKLRHLCLTNDEHMEYKELPKLNSNDYLYEIKEESTCSQKGKAEYLYKIEEQEFIFLVELEYVDHTYEDKWSMDNRYHWHQASCIHKDQRKDNELHDFENGRCLVCGYIGYSEGLVYELNSDLSSYSITGLGSFSDKELVLPSLYQGLPVTKVKESAFLQCDFIEKIRILDGILELGNSCFKGCTKLREIELPSTLKRIGSNCFEGCKSLLQFQGNMGLEEVLDYAFKDCSNLTTIFLPNSLSKLGNAIIEGANVEFYEYDNAYYIGNEENPYLILYQANDTLIKTCKIHENTRFIAGSSFTECRSLISIHIPNQVLSLGDYCFYYCVKLDYVILGKNLNFIGRSAFGNCTSIKAVYYEGSKEEFQEIEISYNNTFNKVYYYSTSPSTEEEWTYDENHNPIFFS